jgi:molybdenum cofactor guanylyltransferase
MTNDAQKLYGLILAGGQSSRMGSDKALLNFHGEPQVVWLHQLLQSFCEHAFVSGSREKIPYPFNFIEDHYETGGPMNGILSAFRLHPDVAWLVLPVDMPNVNVQVIDYLLEHRDDSKLASCFLNPINNDVEPLPIILEPVAYLLLLSRFMQKNESLHRFLKLPEINIIPAPDAKWLDNVNFPWQV